MIDFLLLEDGDELELEDASGLLLLEDSNAGVEFLVEARRRGRR